MARFQIQDPHSGKTVTIEADKAPSQSDSEQIFQQAGLRQKPSQGSLLNTVLQLGGGVVGGIAGGGAGAVGGALIPGADLTGIPEAAGAYAGGVGGAGAGAAAGNATADWIRKTLLGDKSVDLNQTLPNSVQAGKEGAIGQAIGLPFAKGLGMAFHPIASVMSGDVPLIAGVDKTLAKSGKSIDIAKILKNYRENTIPQMQQKGLSTDAILASKKLGVDMTNATKAFQASPDILQNLQTPTNGIVQSSPTDVASMDLPILKANQLARNVQSSVKDFYGQPTQNADIAARKAFGGLLKDAIHTAEPATKLPDSIAHALYQAPNVINGLLQILSFGRPEAATAISQLSKVPNAVTNKVVPQGGGYLNQLLPRAIQLLNSGDQNSRQ